MRALPAKGRWIAVSGRLVYREWTAEDGSRRSKHSVIGRVRFGGRPADSEPAGKAPAEEAQGASDQDDLPF